MRLSALGACCAIWLAFPCWLLAGGLTGPAALNMEGGARAAAMGGAFTAVADDVSALYWNPAGLGQISEPRFLGEHLEWVGGIRREWAGFVQPVQKVASVAAAASILTGGDAPHTTRSLGGYEEIGSFQYSSRHAQFAAASRRMGDVRVGGSLEIFQQGLDFSLSETAGSSDFSEARSDGYAVHLGGIWHPPVLGLKVGGTVRGLGSDTLFYDDSIPLPRQLRLGAAYERQIESAPPEEIPIELAAAPARVSKVEFLTVAADVSFERGASARLHAGAEYVFQNGFAIRAGYRTGAPLTGGFGFAGRSYEIDYAFTPAAELGSAHRISFTLLFR